MKANCKELKNKVAIIGIGTSQLSYSLISHLLEEGTTVVVPAQSSYHLKLLQQYLVGFNTERLVTLLTDLPDFDKAVDLTEMILEQYGPLDLVVFPFELILTDFNFSEISIIEWQRAVEENLASYFISCRAGINAMKQRGEGMFVAVVDIDHLARQTKNSMTDMLMSGQIKMARSFFEEVKSSDVKFHHLFVNNLDTHSNGDQSKTDAITPAMIAKYIIGLYQDDKKPSNSPFLFLVGKDVPGIHQYFNSK